MAGGGRIEHVPWPTLAEQIETGDFVADVVAHPRASSAGRRRVSLAEGLRADDRASTGAHEPS